MRILMVKTSSMGDVIHTLPALTDAQQAIPGLCVDWVVEEGFAQIPSWHSAVDRVIPIAIRRWRKNLLSAQTRQEWRSFKQRLHQERYDAVIDAQGLLKSALLVARNAHGIRHGFDRRSAREPLASLFYDRRHRIARDQHAVERTRQLVAQSLGYPLPVQRGDYAIARHFTQQLPMDAGQYMVFLHATTRDEKHWPEAHWRELIAWVGSHTTQRIKLPWGAEHEHQRALRLAEGFPHVEVLPKMALSDVATVLAGASQVISVDTGLSHLAAALDRPNITLYGPTDPGLIGGYGKNQLEIIEPTHSLDALPSLAVVEYLKNEN
ncbi:lipopolysaccharide heptosyltransferase RfaC [Edwardsiella ictaluri]|uniref:Lipopolysaccharide heptosyltransferase 1 n=1 Tax=Edwardsiella ictaluri (strain 93-146) TaxID=634503 RepID=C5BB95_EDWI9|nr:lipopolysaccharide heptosyltransferase RfaC [Edwardsiella ictaluri]ACR67330.1 lipopolysaccharide heptosyltransferase I, putative [Edwardsiella ictaluri 93-146]ARD39917.1 ADP-heptose--LPS heptosyltransferase [Edwardsiella ictaluri]AVZ82157.1 lipopolysaccharide heptosyltransferase RfaC [Edwardsiella ictaluri]EKS7762668.1 lipopolysaccharide heptosyltransferase RfaC [Edwardsiella ictaluri]EKS7769579.1 lipopolysaccharide heptosyltransferase RfaC [Edwardsiella ictaluri]